MEQLFSVASVMVVDDEARPLQMRALAIDRAAFGADNFKVATNPHNAAEIHRRQGQVTEAEPLHLAALKIRIRALGEDHPDVPGPAAGASTSSKRPLGSQ